MVIVETPLLQFLGRQGRRCARGCLWRLLEEFPFLRAARAVHVGTWTLSLRARCIWQPPVSVYCDNQRELFTEIPTFFSLTVDSDPEVDSPGAVRTRKIRTLFPRAALMAEVMAVWRLMVLFSSFLRHFPRSSSELSALAFRIFPSLRWPTVVGHRGPPCTIRP